MMQIPEQKRFVTLPDGTVPHLRLRKGDTAECVVFSGDPGRVELICSYLQDVRLVSSHRGYFVYSGVFEGTPITVASHGIGGPSVSIVLEELAVSGGKYFIRLGSGAGICRGVAVGQPIIATGAVRDEGTSGYYAPYSFPAVSDLDVVLALRQALTELGKVPYSGVVRTTDSFYEGERKEELIERWSRLGVLLFEMELSTVFCMAPILGVKVGGMVVAGANLVEGTSTYAGSGLEDYKIGMDAAIRAALKALTILQSN